jgi:hypothetical protein
MTEEDPKIWATVFLGKRYVLILATNELGILGGHFLQTHLGSML